MTEGGMTQVMTQGNCLGEVFIKVKGSRYSTGYLSNLQGVSKPGHIMVTQGSDEDLRLVLEAAKGLGVDNAVSVTLEGSAYRADLLIFKPAPRRLAFSRIRGKALFLYLSFLANIKPTNHLI